MCASQKRGERKTKCADRRTNGRPVIPSLELTGESLNRAGSSQFLSKGHTSSSEGPIGARSSFKDCCVVSPGPLNSEPLLAMPCPWRACWAL